MTSNRVNAVETHEPPKKAVALVLEDIPVSTVREQPKNSLSQYSLRQHGKYREEIGKGMGTQRRKVGSNSRD